MGDHVVSTTCGEVPGRPRRTLNNVVSFDAWAELTFVECSEIEIYEIHIHTVDFTGILLN